MNIAGFTPRQRRCIAFVSHTVSATALRTWQELTTRLGNRFDVIFVSTEMLPLEQQSLVGDNFVYLKKEQIFEVSYFKKSVSGKIIPGNCDLIVLALSRIFPDYEFIWYIEYDVYFPFGCDILRVIDNASDADLLLPLAIVHKNENPEWMWWKTLETTGSDQDVILNETAAYSIFCVSRYGKALLRALHDNYQAGWAGHNEVTAPTTALAAHLKIETMNEIAFRQNGLPVLSIKTFNVEKCVSDELCQIYHPVKTESVIEALHKESDFCFSRAVFDARGAEARGDLKAAAEAWRIAATLKPAHLGANAGLCWALLKLGKLDEAEAACMAGLAVKPDQPEVFHRLALIARRRGDETTEIESFRRVLGLKPNDAWASLELATTLLKNGQIDEAENLCRALLAADAHPAQAHIRLGLIARRRGDRDVAIGHFQAALLIEPANAWAAKELATERKGPAVVPAGGL